MSTEKRDRQRQNRARRIAEAEEEARSAAAKKRTTMLGGSILAAVAIVGGIFLISRSRGDDIIDVAPPATVTPDSAGTTVVDEPEIEPPPVITVPESGGSIDGAAECPPDDGSGDRITSFGEAPPMCIDVTKSYTAEINTNKGVFIIDLDAEAAPATVNNFVTLARYNYYDGVAFHRVMPGFVVQGGDAVGPNPGSGGPGYRFEDELQGGEGPFYEIGSVAMANSGPNTNGSQFFVVTGDNGAALPDLYNRFGSVSTGFDVVEAIEAIGSPDGSGQPLEEVIIESVTIIES